MKLFARFWGPRRPGMSGLYPQVTAGTRGYGACGRRPGYGRSWATVSSLLLPPPPRGGATAPAIRQEAPPGAAQECSARGSAAQPLARGRKRHPGRALPGAWGPIVPQVQKLGLGHQLLPPCWTRGAWWLRSGPAVPGGPASGRTGPRSSSAPRPACWGGGAILPAWPGAPRLPSPPSLGPPCVSPVHAPPPPPRHWGLAPPRPWGPGTPGPRSAPNVTSRLTGGGQ